MAYVIIGVQMNIHDLFTATTEQQLSDIAKRNDGLIKLNSAIMHFQGFNEFIADVASDTRISRPGRAQPATVIYIATLAAQSLQITCTTFGNSLFVNSIETIEV
jgi:deoxyxylulose-5-phosphate synthase